jgi:hypothetical protein
LWLRDYDVVGFALDDPVPNGGPAPSTEILVLITFRKHEKEPFSHRHGPLAFGAI